MRIAMIGQDVPTLLPALLTDLLFAGGGADADVTVEEGNPAMQELLQGYGEKIFAKAGKGGTFCRDTGTGSLPKPAKADHSGYCPNGRRCLKVPTA